MKNKWLILLLSLILTGVTFSSCVKDLDDDDKAMVFLGSESYFKFFDEVIPDTLAAVFAKYTDSVSYDYLNLYNISFIATRMGGSYKVEQNPFVEFKDPFEDLRYRGMKDFSAKLRLSGQNNCIISMEMIFDTVVDTEDPFVQYRMYESIVADTMYVVGEVGDTGRFLMYGIADNEVNRGYYDNGVYLDNYYREYTYKSNIIMVGERTANGIRRIAYFEHICDDYGSIYPVGSIRAFGDKDDMSNFY